MKQNGSQSSPIVQIRSLTKSYNKDCSTCAILDDVDLDIFTGELLVLLGISGSGKSTLLNLLSGIDNADAGQIWIEGVDLIALSEHHRTVFRRDHIGIVFQFFNLIPTLTVLENITLPLELRGADRKQTEQRARLLLERVGLFARAADYPDKLSGGEQQRIAIARALIHEPALVLADEPTGNLDEETGKNVLNLLFELTRQAGKTLVMATHNPEIVPLADRVCRIHDGKLHMTINQPQPIGYQAS